MGWARRQEDRLAGIIVSFIAIVALIGVLGYAAASVERRQIERESIEANKPILSFENP